MDPYTSSFTGSISFSLTSENIHLFIEGSEAYKIFIITIDNLDLTENTQMKLTVANPCFRLEYNADDSDPNNPVYEDFYESFTFQLSPFYSPNNEAFLPAYFPEIVQSVTINNE